MERRAGSKAETMLAGLAAVTLAGWSAASLPLQARAQQPAQQQAVPDAPKPQTLPRLNTVVPPAPAVPNAPAASATTGALLPSAPVPSAPTPTVAATAAAQAQAQAKDDVIVPPKGQGAYQLPTQFVSFVEVPFLVKDTRGQMVPGITERDVQVFENGVKQNIRYFTPDPFPLSVALVIDQSVTFDTMNTINNALGALQGAFAPSDQIAVFTYNNGVKMQDPIGFDGAQSARLGAILNQSKGKGREPQMDLGGPMAQTTLINNQYADPNTSPNHRTSNITEYAEREFHTLNDAILAAAVQVSKVGVSANGQRLRRIVYVISDGKEYGSKAKEKDVIKFCQRNNIAVYATLVGDSSLPVVGFLDRIHLPLTMRDNALPRYTTATGGQLDAELRQTGIEKSFAKIAEESRAQYFLGFYSRLPPLGEQFRTLEVKVLRPNLTVIAKEGYYPNASPNRPTAPPAQTAKPPVSSSPATSQ